MTEVLILLKATIVLTVALLAVTVMRGARASLRALLLSAAFAVLVVLPFAGLVIPERTIELPIPYAVTFPLVLEQVEPGASEISVMGTRADNVATEWRLPSIATMLRALWAMVTLCLLLRLGVALWRLGTTRRSSVPWMDGQAFLATLTTDRGRRTEVFLHEELSAPITVGVVRPVIGLPMDAREWPRAALRHALLHELEHVRRGDWPVHLFVQVACALYWFHPLVWMASRRLCLEAERACDDAVLCDAERTAYAEQLVSLARRVSTRSPIAVLSMAARSDLSTRVRAVLDARQARGRAGVFSATLVTLGAAALTIAISPLQAVAPLTDATMAGQSAPGAQRMFEVAAVRPNTSATLSQTLGLKGNTFIARNVTLKQLILSAYDTGSDRLSGGPGWIDSDRYDVEAKPDGDASWDEQMQMLQALLADRFSLTVRREVKETPVYALVVAKNGPRLQRAADPECIAPPSERCGGFTTRPGRFAGRRVTVAQIAGLLSGGRAGRPVINDTNIDGFFDMELTWARPDAPTTDDPSLFTALEEALGLRLQPATAPMEHLVIERVERLTLDDAPQAPAAGSPPRAPTPGAPAFEVVSVKSNRSGETRIGWETPPGRFTATNVPLRFLIRQAYRIPESRLVGGPDWLYVDRFDIRATASVDGATSDTTRQMIRALLADRFQLAAHMETREMPIYTLVPMRNDGTLGPHLRPSSTDCGGPGAGPRMADGRVQCGVLVSQGPASASLRGGGTPFAEFVRFLGDFLERPVVDRSGLTGIYDVELQFTADRGAVPGVPGGLAAASNPGEIPSVFTAVQEQIGLKLEAQRGLVEVLVIDRVEQPSEN